MLHNLYTVDSRMKMCEQTCIKYRCGCQGDPEIDRCPELFKKCLGPGPGWRVRGYKDEICDECRNRQKLKEDGTIDRIKEQEQLERERKRKQ